MAHRNRRLLSPNERKFIRSTQVQAARKVRVRSVRAAMIIPPRARPMFKVVPAHAADAFQPPASDGRLLNVLHVATVNKPIASANGYGPIEAVIQNLDRGLHRLGHRSIVACSADSRVAGEHYPTLPMSLGDYCRDSSDEVERAVNQHLLAALKRAREPDIDIVHMHQWFERVYGGSFNPGAPIVMTLHVPGAASGIAEFHKERSACSSGRRPLPALHAVAISSFQRRQYASLMPVAKTIPHGIDVSEFLFGSHPSNPEYLFSIGRLTSDKGQDTAIEVARKSGKKLVIAGCVQNKDADREYFKRLSPSFELQVDLGQVPVTPDYYDRVMKPLLSSDRNVIYVGELGAAAAKRWYSHATATLFPIRWGEPFGMVLIESMASGTPIVAFGEGSVPEIVKHGETGFIVDSIESMVRAVARLGEISRAACRKHVEQRFSTTKMTASYADLYRRLDDDARRKLTVAGRPRSQASQRALRSPVLHH